MGDFQQTAQQKLYTHLQTALEMLAKRVLGEPYNMHRISDQIRPEMLQRIVHADYAEIIGECLKQFKKTGSYSASTVAVSLSRDVGELQSLSMEESGMDLVTAFDFFFESYCRYSETEIMQHQTNWLLDGDTNTEIIAKAEKMRREKGMGARVHHSDGRAEFEQALFSSFEGIVYDYPIKPFLNSLRSQVPFFRPGDYIVVAMLSGGGKSYFAMNQILYSANQNIPSLYINLENAPMDVQERLWQMYCDTKFESDFSKMPIDEMMKLKSAWEKVKELPIKSVNPGPFLHNIISEIRQHKYERGIELAVIDYAQLVYINGYKSGRVTELTEISAKFRALSLELEIPVMVLAQVKQEVMQRPDKRAFMYDIADCKNFTQDASLILLPYRPDYVNVLDREIGPGVIEAYPEGYADIFVGKGRRTGRLGAECRFNHIKGFHDVPSVFEERILQNAVPDWSPKIGMPATRSEPLDVPF